MATTSSRIPSAISSCTRGSRAQQLDDDLTAWDALAKENGYAPAHSFAFPWGASNSLTAEYYAVLAKHGITNVTRFYDNKPGTVQLGTVPVYPQIRVVPDQELIDRAGDEAAAQRGIDTALAFGGVFSVWAHPENIATANAQAIWGRVVAYAADRRSLGLWVAPVTTITNFVDARDQSPPVERAGRRPTPSSRSVTTARAAATMRRSRCRPAETGRLDGG